MKPIKSNKVERKRTGIYKIALVGPKEGEIGEVVKYWSWGGMDLKFEDNTIITFANMDMKDIFN